MCVCVHVCMMCVYVWMNGWISVYGTHGMVCKTDLNMVVYTDCLVAHNRNFNITHLWKVVFQIITLRYTFERFFFLAAYVYNHVCLSLFKIISSNNIFIGCIVGSGYVREWEKENASVVCVCMCVCGVSLTIKFKLNCCKEHKSITTTDLIAEIFYRQKKTESRVSLYA